MPSRRYEVKQTRQAERDLLRLRAWTVRATNELVALEADPFRGHTLTGGLKGARALEFSLPGGQYRAAYVIRENVPKQDHPNETESICLVFMVGPHENFCREAERRLKALRRSGDLTAALRAGQLPTPAWEERAGDPPGTANSDTYTR